jgi:putative transcriptional regulator
MNGISHHIPEPVLAAYAAGSLGYAFELVVASHVSMCDECRARLGAHEALGGAVLENGAGQTLSSGLKASVLGRLDEAPAAPARFHRSGIFPAPIVEALGGQAPRWRSLGLGVKQCILHEGDAGSVRLLSIPPEQAVPEHSHRGLELTLVLQGSFHDETGEFSVGDVEVADHEVDHIPTAGKGPPCICLAATDAPLRFTSLIPQLTQRFFRI